MSFQTGLSGLNASSRNLDVIGNNIANANTIGMKSSRAEFAELVTSNLGAGGGGGSGIGVSVATVSQQFSQGSINMTGNNLDVAINGGGFFELKMPDGSAAFTRDGEFKLDKDGFIKSNLNANVLGYKIDSTGKPIIGDKPTPLQLPTSAPIAAKPTSTITAEFNLDARAPVATSVTPATPRTTYGTSLTAYDSQGTPVPVSLYFERIAPTAAIAAVPASVGPPAVAAVTAVPGSDNWNVYDVATGGTPFLMQFDASGKLTSPTTSPVLTITPNSTVIPPFNATLDISKVTQYGSAFAVSNLTQNGYAPGELTSLKIGKDGVITASYSNGQSQAAGQIALADFRNVQGLSPTGGGNWVETSASGQPVQGSPGSGKFGALTSGALEDSNVDLTAELVNMMTAQRAYQANAQTIKTQDQVMTTLVNLR